MIFGVTSANALMSWRGSWSNGVTYSKYAIVQTGGNNYISKVDGNLSNAPASSPAYWDLFASGGAGSSWVTGSSTGTGARQTFAHGLGGTPTRFTAVGTGGKDIVAAKSADNINVYIVVPSGQTYNWSAGL